MGVLPAAVDNRPCSQVLADQLQNTLIPHLSADPGHQDVMDHCVEKFRQIAVNSYTITLTDIIPNYAARRPFIDNQQLISQNNLLFFNAKSLLSW